LELKSLVKIRKKGEKLLKEDIWESSGIFWNLSSYGENISKFGISKWKRIT